MAKNALTLFREDIFKETPGCAYLVSRGTEVQERFFGGSSLVEPRSAKVSEATLFDLASLTKPLCAALVALKAHALGKLDINEPVSSGEGKFTPLDLMRHEAGFPPWLPLYLYGSRDEAKDALLKMTPLRPSGEEAVYSCPGYILLGFILEEKLDAPIGDLFDKLIMEPLGIEKSEALFNPTPELRERAAGTELRGDFEREMAAEFGCVPPPAPTDGLWGIVHDGNARFLGGAAGNSGLFATLGGTFALAKAFLPSSSFLPPDILALAYSKGRASGGEWRSAGFKLKGSPSWRAGEPLPNGSVAHEGFTGTLLAITADEEIMILLTNRIHPKHPRTPFSDARASFLKAASDLLR